MKKIAFCYLIILAGCTQFQEPQLKTFVLENTSVSMPDCMLGPGQPASPECAMFFDLDCCADGDVDLADYAKLQIIHRPYPIDIQNGTISGRIWPVNGECLPGEREVVLISFNGEIIDVQDIGSNGSFCFPLPENFNGIVRLMQ